jgi:SAM-dependent methyltransferase
LEDKQTSRVRSHYAQVAADVQAATRQNAEGVTCGTLPPAGGAGAGGPASDTFGIAGGAPAGGCSICAGAKTEQEARSEAAVLYGQDVIASLPAGARLASRGCGDPVAKAGICPGQCVLDLGSGGGIDALIAGRLVGSAGRVIGVDMTAEMIELARQNAQAAGAGNVEFRQGFIENLPVESASVDVVISNCVVNLSANKQRVLEEAARVLKPGGRFVVSDIVALEALDARAEPLLRQLTGCQNGMIERSQYVQMLEQAGFKRAQVEPKTVYTLGVFEQRMRKRGKQALFVEAACVPGVDGTTASAIIYAYK